jgi:hypothetical protein
LVNLVPSSSTMSQRWAKTLDDNSCCWRKKKNARCLFMRFTTFWSFEVLKKWVL